ncbi:MAG: hypothetical protein O9972_09680 [Burkholderiales bacterium]|nr:hypothetical protein [Burkholderiales bacterium]
MVDTEARRAEISVSLAQKDGRDEPEYAKRAARAMRAVERILVGVERFWDTAPPAAMSIKEMVARHEAVYVRRPREDADREEQTEQRVVAANSLDG